MAERTYEHAGHVVHLDDTPGAERLVVGTRAIKVLYDPDSDVWWTPTLAYHEFGSLQDLADVVAERAVPVR